MAAMPKQDPSLTLALLQAREAAMSFFRPLLNQHDLTEQQWRVIRILSQYPHGELESHQLAEMACILRPSMTGVLVRLERDGLVRRWKPVNDQRRHATGGGQAGSAIQRPGSVAWNGAGATLSVEAASRAVKKAQALALALGLAR